MADRRDYDDNKAYSTIGGDFGGSKDSTQFLQANYKEGFRGLEDDQYDYLPYNLYNLVKGFGSDENKYNFLTHPDVLKRDKEDLTPGIDHILSKGTGKDVRKEMGAPEPMEMPKRLADMIDPLFPLSKSGDGYTGYENQGSNKIFYSKTLPKGHPAAKALNMFDNDLYKLASNISNYTENRTKDNILHLEKELINKGYLDSGHNPRGSYDKKVSSAIRRYYINMASHPERSIMKWLKDQSKNLF